MTRHELLVAYLGLILLELQHLKWIWLEYRKCPRCTRKNLECDCPERRKLKYLI